MCITADQGLWDMTSFVSSYRNPLRLSLWSVFAVLLLAGCGGTGTSPNPSATSQNSPAASPSPALAAAGLKVLVIAADGNEADFSAIQQALNAANMNATYYFAAKTPGGLTSDKLSSNGQPLYQAVILATGSVAFTPDIGQTWLSALTSAEWQTLWNFESTNGIREVSWYTYPTAVYDFGNTPTPINTLSGPAYTAQFTPAGQSLFSHVNAASLTISGAFLYLAQPVADGTNTPLLVDNGGNALAMMHKYSDGREVLVLTFDSNAKLPHIQAIAPDLLLWLAKK